jgi:hypothetical protein
METDPRQGRKLYKRVKIEHGPGIEDACIFGRVGYSTDQSRFFIIPVASAGRRSGARCERKSADRSGVVRPEAVE